jgi:hypothetical protein
MGGFAVEQRGDSSSGRYTKVKLPVSIKPRRGASVSLSFDWTPSHSQKLRLGEERLLLAPGSTEIRSYPKTSADRNTYRDLPPLANSPDPPLLRVKTDMPMSEFEQAHPAPYYSQRNLVAWPLNTQRGFRNRRLLEVTLVNNRVRFLADQSIQIAFLGAGLLLGLIAEPAAIRFTGRKNRESNRRSGSKT